MKDDARRFLFTMFSVPAMLAAAAGVHGLMSVNVADIATEAQATPVEIITTSAPAVVPAKTTTATAKTAKSATKTPAPISATPTPVVVAPVPVVAPPTPTPDPIVYRTVVRSRRTSAS